MDEQLYAEERKQSIVNIVNEKNRIQVAELADLFNVTGSTIRNDLRELENEGLVTRTHGGVIKRDFQRSVEIIPKSREFTNEKYRIAERAVRLIEENDILAIDTGTSCRAFAEKLINSSLKRLTILTYDLEIGLLLSEKPIIKYKSLAARFAMVIHMYQAALWHLVWLAFQSIKSS